MREYEAIVMPLAGEGRDVLIYIIIIVSIDIEGFANYCPGKDNDRVHRKKNVQ